MDAPQLMRMDGWETRLDAVIEQARSRPYALGRHDCLRVACAAVQALTGEDFWPRWSGRYGSKAEALRLIRQTARDLGAAVTSVTGIEPSPALTAQRGDLVLFRDDGGEHLGVCVGAHVAVLGHEGLQFVPLVSEALGPAWRIG